MRFAFLVGSGLAIVQASLFALLGFVDVFPPGVAREPGPAPVATPPTEPARGARRTRSAPTPSPEARVHPFVAPICPEVTVSIVSEAPDFAWSRATLRAPGRANARALRFGGSLGGRRVVYVGHNPIFDSPAVWLSDGPDLCQALLRHPPGPRPTGTQREVVESPAAASAHSLIRFVEVVDADSIRIDRRLLYLALGDAHALAPALRGVSGRLTGDGFLLTRVSAGSLPAALGLRSGDRLVAVNGHPIAGPEGMVAAYAKLQREARTKLTLSRGARTLQLEYTFE